MSSRIRRLLQAWWLELALIFSLVGLFSQLWPDIARAWREWPRPGQQTPARAKVSLSDGFSTEIQYFVYLPRSYATTQHWPLLLFLHGSGSRGDDLDQVLKGGPPEFAARKREFPMIIVSPQCRANTSWDSRQLLALLDHLQQKFSIDQDRIYVSGYSMGGYGTWDLAAAAPERIAAIVPVAGGGNVDQAPYLLEIPIWAFHGTKDRAVPIENHRQIVEAIQAAGGNARLTVYENRGHDTCNLTFGRDDVYQWLLQQKRGK